MTNKETIERNIGLTFDFVNHLIDNKEELENLPENFTLEFIEKDFPKIQRKENHKHTRKKYIRVQNTFAVL